jgi:spermidine synthase
MFSKSDRVRIVLGLLVLGFTTILVQVTVIREFLKICIGNELITGMLWAVWMILTSLGAIIAVKFKKQDEAKQPLNGWLYVAMAVLPFVMVLVIRYSRNLFFLPGSTISLFQSLGFATLVLFPFCILSGILFSRLSIRPIFSGNPGLKSFAYWLESFGGVIGGAFSAIIVLYAWNVFDSLILVLLVDLFVAFIFLIEKHRLSAIFCLIFMAVALLGFYFVPFNSVTLRWLYPQQTLRYANETPYGDLVVTQSDEQFNFYSNSQLLFATQNIIECEEDVHFCMLQHASPKNILLVGGGVSGTVPEVLKYKINRLDYVELNPGILDLASEFHLLPDTSILHVYAVDAKLFLHDSKQSYDIVLMNVPAPSNVLINRYYTLEFMQSIKEKSNPGLIVQYALPTAGIYQGTEATFSEAILYKTLKEVFTNVLVIQGDKNYFLASDAPLTTSVVALQARRKIETLYVNSNYLDDDLLGQQSRLLIRNFKPDVNVNTNFKPTLFWEQLVYWLRYFRTNPWVLGILALAFFLLFFLFLRPAPLALFCAGFGASGMQFVLVFVFQILYGQFYLYIGLLTALFMLSLAAGAMWGYRLIPVKQNKRIAFPLAMLALVMLFTPILLGFLKEYDAAVWVWLMVIMLLIVIAFCTGTVFSLALDTPHNHAALLYSADLAGASLGALLVSVYLVPLAGIFNTCFLMGLLCLLAAILNLRPQKINHLQ